MMVEIKKQIEKKQEQKKQIQAQKQCGWCPKMLLNNEGFCSKECEEKWFKEYLW